MYHYNTMPWSMLIASKLLEAALPCSPEVSGFRSPNWFSPPHSCRQPASNPEWMHPKDIESFNDSVFEYYSYYQLIPIPTKNSGNRWGICRPMDQPPQADSTHASTKVEIFLASRQAKKRKPQGVKGGVCIYIYIISDPTLYDVHYFTCDVSFASSVSVSMFIVIESHSPFCNPGHLRCNSSL